MKFMNTKISFELMVVNASLSFFDLRGIFLFFYFIISHIGQQPVFYQQIEIIMDKNIYNWKPSSIFSSNSDM